MAVISFENVNLIRNHHDILTNISWNVNKGENWAILGLNGSGKSSLIKLIMAEIWKSSGRLEVLDVEFGAGQIPELRQKIAIVGSFIAERFHGDIHSENLVYTGKFNSSFLYKNFSDEDLDEARELLRQIGAEQLIGRVYGTLSQGEKQLCLIARSLILKPEILILDEATNGLDLFAKENLLTKLHEILQLDNPPTLLYITHHVDEITSDFDQILLLRDGQIVKAGEKSELLTSSNLTEFYQHDVTVKSDNGRYYALPKK